MTQPQIMPVNEVIEIRKNGAGYPTVVVDGWDIGAWILAEPIIVEQREDGLNVIAVNLATRDLRLNNELVSSTTPRTLTIDPQH